MVIDPAHPPDGGPLRVLFFNCWPTGMDRFAKFIDLVDAETAEFQLLHYGSFYDRFPIREVITGYLTRGLPSVDIQAFRPQGLAEVVAALAPEAVVVGTNGSLWDRTMFLTCKRRGIPVVFLQHGSWPDPDDYHNLTARVDGGFTVMDRLRRIPKFLTVLPWYLEARAGNRLDLSLWRMIVRLAGRPSMSHFYPNAPEELWPDVALFFTESAARTLRDSHKIPADRMRVVGNPELDAAYARRIEPLSSERRSSVTSSLGLDPARPVVCYLDDGFPEQQVLPEWDKARRLAAIREFYAACGSVGAQLLVRPHPGIDDTSMRQELAGKPGSAVDNKLPLLDAVDISDAILGFMSTANETALVLGKPVMVPAWLMAGELELSPFLRYNVGVKVSSAGELPDAIAKAIRREYPPVDLKEFSERRLGPVDGAASRRIVDAVLDAARQTREKRRGARGREDH